MARLAGAAADAADELADLLERVPAAASLPAVAQALADELAEQLGAHAVTVWVRRGARFGVAGGVGLGATEARLHVDDDHPFLGRIATNRHAILVHPLDDIRGFLVGLAGARGSSLLAAPVTTGERVIAIVTAGLDREAKPRDLDRLIGVVDEATPLLRVATQVAQLTTR